MSFQSQRDLTDAKHHAMIWDILLHKGGGGGGSTEGHFPSCSAMKTIVFPLICPTLFGRDCSILAFTDLED